VFSNVVQQYSPDINDEERHPLHVLQKLWLYCNVPGYLRKVMSNYMTAKWLKKQHLDYFANNFLLDFNFSYNYSIVKWLRK